MNEVTVRLERLEAGWASIQLETAHATYQISASFVGGRDSLEELVHLGASALRSVPMEVWFEGEPHQWRLAVEPEAPGRVNMTVHRFQNRIRRQPKELGSPDFQTPCDGTALAREVRNIFSVWKNEAADYEKRWYHPFPTRALGLLEAAIAA